MKIQATAVSAVLAFGLLGAAPVAAQMDQGHDNGRNGGMQTDQGDMNRHDMSRQDMNRQDMNRQGMDRHDGDRRDMNRDGDHHDGWNRDGDHGRQMGWHHHHQNCWMVWRHHHRQRVCGRR